MDPWTNTSIQLLSHSIIHIEYDYGNEKFNYENNQNISVVSNQNKSHVWCHSPERLVWASYQECFVFSFHQQEKPTQAKMALHSQPGTQGHSEEELHVSA